LYNSTDSGYHIIESSNLLDKFKIAQLFEKGERYLEALDMYEEAFQANNFNQDVANSIIRMYLKLDSYDLEDRYEKFEQKYNKIYELKLDMHDTYNREDVQKDRLKTIRDEIKIGERYNSDRSVLMLYKIWNEVDQFDPEAIEGVAKYHLKRNEFALSKQKYEFLLSLVDDTKKAEIEKIISSIEQMTK